MFMCMAITYSVLKEVGFMKPIVRNIFLIIVIVVTVCFQGCLYVTDTPISVEENIGGTDLVIPSEQEEQVNKNDEDRVTIPLKIKEEIVTVTPTPTPTPIMTEESQEIVTVTPTPIMAEESQEIDLELEQIKEAILTTVNDCVWLGYMSEFMSHHINTTSYYEVFVTDKYPDEMEIIFVKCDDKQSININTYYKDSRGYLNGFSSNWWTNTLEEAQQRLEAKGYKFFKSSYITFGEVKEPEYTQITENKQEMIDSIEQIIYDALDTYRFEDGTYTTYIKNFWENDRLTFALIENDDDEAWLMSVLVEGGFTARENRFYVDSYYIGEVSEDSFFGKIKSFAIFEKQYTIVNNNILSGE